MRIIAGDFRGRSLESVRDLSVRPTTDRAKQTIFDILTNRVDFSGLDVLDLFAGSGSLGLEAISRGANSVTFIDKSRKSLEVLEKNVASLKCKSQCSVYQADVFWYLKNVKRVYDLVFTDPPYKLENISVLPNTIYDSGAVRDGSYVVMEHSRESMIELNNQKYEIHRKQFGQTTVLILKAIVPLTLPRT
jgi:16S rRNA (guanine(966)-N(2))-methyltransferase RsmD